MLIVISWWDTDFQFNAKHVEDVDYAKAIVDLRLQCLHIAHSTNVERL